MSEQTVTKKKTNKLLVLVIIILLAVCGSVGYLIASGKLTLGDKKAAKEYSTNLGEFVVNLSDESPTYIKANISIGYTNKKAAKTIEKKLPQIRDCINKFMLSKTSDDFNGEVINTTGEDLIKRINETLGNEIITGIYFEQIIIQ